MFSSCGGQANEPVKKGVSFTTEENEHLGNGNAGEHFNIDNIDEASGKGVDHHGGGREVCFSDVDELHAFL